MTLEDSLMIERLCKNDSEAVYARKNIGQLRKLKELSKFIRSVTLHSQFDNVIDLHYLLSQLHRIETEFKPKLLREVGEVSALAEN